MVASMIPPTTVPAPEPKHLNDMTEADLGNLIGLELQKALVPLIPQAPTLKGTPVRVFSNQASDLLSDKLLDFRGFNAASVQVTVNGTTPTAVISMEGSDGGILSSPLPDPNAMQLVTASCIFECAVGTAFGRVRLKNVSGTFTVTVTPFVSPGPLPLNPSLISTGVTGDITDDTAAEVLAAAGAGMKWRVTAIAVSNSHATVGTWVTVQDDSDTPVVYWREYCAPAGGGFNLAFMPPLEPKGQANGKVNVVCETTGANVGASVSGFKVPA